MLVPEISRSAPIRSSTSRKPRRPGPTYTFSTTTSLPGVMQAATTQKAAWDGSPGTSSSNGRRGEGRTVIRPGSIVTSAPARASSSSVWARTGSGSRRTVSPSAPRPASSTAPFTWPLATGSV